MDEVFVLTYEDGGEFIIIGVATDMEHASNMINQHFTDNGWKIDRVVWKDLYFVVEVLRGGGLFFVTVTSVKLNYTVDNGDY